MAVMASNVGRAWALVVGLADALEIGCEQYERGASMRSRVPLQPYTRALRAADDAPSAAK
jgi:hypothetical protein